MALILFGGLYVQRLMDKYDSKSIDQHGAYVQAVVYRKAYIKGYLVYFEYTFKGQKYYNHEQGKNLYETLHLGDTITIKLDSTSPQDSYIFSTSK